MSKRKPLSAGEKRDKLLEIFHETNEVYQLKDLERLAPQKGIVLKSVKNTLRELVDNGLVQSEKISGSIYFWSFPSENSKNLQEQLDDIKSNTAKVQERLDIAKAQLKTNENCLEDTAAVEVISKEIEVLIKEKQTLENQIKEIQGKADYIEIKAKEDNTKKLLEAANRWTDNIFMAKTWCKRKFEKQDKELNKAFGIPEELDYVDT